MGNIKSNLLGLTLWIVTAIAAFGGAEVSAQEEPPPFEVTEKEIILPGVIVDRATQEVHIEATVCLTSGILEYVVCKPGTFEHESIFTTKAKPELVHASLLLCGLKPTPLLAGMTDLWWEKAMKQQDSRVKIEAQWEEDGARKRVNLTDMIRSREDSGDVAESVGEKKQNQEVPLADAWIFAGSFLQMDEKSGERFYAANVSGILVGIWPDPSTVIQYGLASGNPYDDKAQGMEIREEVVPKLDTKVKLIFSRQTAAIKGVAPEE